MTTPSITAFYQWLTLEPEDLLAQCRRTPYQASGPGGQKRNRVYSAIRLEHPPSGLRSESGAHREAGRNRQDALRKLRLALALVGSRQLPLPRPHALPDSEKQELPLPPTDYPAFRAKISVNHQDFPAAVLLALLVFRGSAGEPRGAARQLGVSTSAFVKFLKLDKAVLAEANAIRKDLGRDSLH